MVFKRINYHSGQEIFEIRVKGSSGGVIENWVVMKENALKVFETIIKKYGLRKPKNDRDLEWAL